MMRDRNRMRNVRHIAACGLIIVIGFLCASGQQKPQKVAVSDAVLEALNAGDSEYKASDLEAYSVDLNGDGTPEIVITGRSGTDLCSGSGNCTLWVLGSTPDGYVDLVHHHHEHDGDILDSIASGWKSLDTTHDGYHDLEFFYHDSAVTATATKYQMQNGQYEYVPGSCEALTYGFFDDQGNFHEYNPPKSKPCDSGRRGK